MLPKAARTSPWFPMPIRRIFTICNPSFKKG
jgi:hypothetical protein